MTYVRIPSARLPLIACLALAALVSTGLASAADNGGPHTDLALHRPTTGSPICKPGEEVRKAVNGRTASKTQDKFCSLHKPAWMQVDLQGMHTLRGFTLKHAGAGNEPASMNTRAFTISVSTDARHWKKVVSVHDNTASVTRHSIEPIKARYVRLDVTEPTQTDDPATRIYELEVW